MLAAADHAARYTEQTIYESEWTENMPTGISWLNLLTSQPIPEETDGIDSPCVSSRHRSGSDCSSSSAESCYVVLEIQRPRSADDTTSKVEQESVNQAEEKEVEDEDEEEEIQEVIEEFHFAQINVDNHQIEHEQTVASMTIEMPRVDCAVEHQQEQTPPMEDYVQMTEISIEQAPSDLPVPRAKALSKFTKRLPPMPSKSIHDSDLSSSSDEELANITKLKTIRKVNEYHPTVISAVTAEQQGFAHRQSSMGESDSPHCSTTSLDSIEKEPAFPPVQPTRAKATFSNLSTQRVANPVQPQRPSPPVRIATLTRTFAFDRACMEKYGPVPKPANEYTEHATVRKDEIKSFPTTNEPENSTSSPSVDQLHCRSFTDTIPTPFYLEKKAATFDESDFNRSPSICDSQLASDNFAKGSSILCRMKKYARTVSSEYRLPQGNETKLSNEPTLLEVKYLDGRLPLKDDTARESFRNNQILSGSVSSRLNRIGLHKMSSTQDLSVTTKSLNGSCRKRILNRFRTLLENNTGEEQGSSQPRPWQHKTISELFHERKYKVNRQ